MDMQETTGMYLVLTIVGVLVIPLIAMKVHYLLTRRQPTMGQVLPDYGVAVLALFAVTKVLLQVVHMITGIPVPWPCNISYILAAAMVAAALPCMWAFARRWVSISVELRGKHEGKTDEKK